MQKRKKKEERKERKRKKEERKEKKGKGKEKRQSKSLCEYRDALPQVTWSHTFSDLQPW